jgi:hypothetical protein
MVGLLSISPSVYAQQRASSGRNAAKKPAASNIVASRVTATKTTPSKTTPSKKAAAQAATSRQARVPAALVGTWVWGVANPGKYVNPATGEYAGHAGGGAVSYTFGKGGTYKRYTLIHFGAGFSNESIFSSMEGTTDFNEAAGTFTIRFIRGQITFEKKSGMQKRPLSRQDMEQGGTTFTYSLQKDENGTTVLLVNDKGKPASEGRRFYKEVEEKK